VVRLEAEVTILGRLAELPGGGPDRERIYGFVDVLVYRVGCRLG